MLLMCRRKIVWKPFDAIIEARKKQKQISCIDNFLAQLATPVSKSHIPANLSQCAQLLITSHIQVIN